MEKKIKIIGFYNNVIQKMTLYPNNVYKLYNVTLFSYNEQYKTLNISIKFLNELIHVSEYGSIDYLSVCEILQSYLQKDFNIKIEKFSFKHFND